MSKKGPTVLCVLDGFGLNPDTHGNAVELANPSNFKNVFRNSPSATLVTYGERVGLPAGQMGNSEVGHLNIGAGRVVEQWLLRISNALKGDFLQHSKEFNSFVNSTRHSPALHLIGLFSDGGIHSHYHHLDLLLSQLNSRFSGNIFLHLLTDGRDTAPTSSSHAIEQLQTRLNSYPNVRIKSVIGRFYAMDRDKRWERTEKAFGAIALGQGRLVDDPVAAINQSYSAGVTDEFIEPIVLDDTPSNPNDGVIFWNFREDRMRQIVSALSHENFAEFGRHGVFFKPDKVLCFTEYDKQLGLPFLFAPVPVNNHLGEVVALAGKHQLRVAETEKYPHVTYFFNGKIEEPYANEIRKLIPSPRDVRTYDLKPEMSAYQVCSTVVEAIRAGNFDLIVVNFANCDMVGHTGELEAGIKAVQVVNECLGEILSALEQHDGQAIILADHGNAEYMQNADGSPNTAHTVFPVPVIVCGCENISALRPDGALCDVAPTVLEMMGLEIPKEMKGRSLLVGSKGPITLQE